MRVISLTAVLILSLPAFTFAQKREVQELQRDVQLLTQEVRALDGRMGKLELLVQQTLDAVTKGNTSVAVLEKGLGDRLSEQQKTLAGPVSNVGGKVDQMSQEFVQVKESVTDLSSRMTKMQNQLTDISSAIKTLGSPPSPPSSTGVTSPGASTGPPPGMSADSLFNNALRDKLSGNSELALQGFRDYVQFYGNTDLAPVAQFHIGDVLFARRDYENALSAFDLVLEKYSDNPKTLDAMYLKGRSLYELNQRTAAAQEFREVIKRSPSNDLATKSRAQLKSMGLTAPATGTSKKR